VVHGPTDYISKIYGEGLQERSETIRWHYICLA